MKGLIYENFYLLKKQFILSGILLFLCGVFSILVNPFIFYSMSTILVSMLPITACVYENENNLTKVILTMPINRKDFVLSKYISTSILGFINLIINLFFMYFITSNFLKSFIFSTISFIFGMLVMDYMFPLIFRFGVEKAKGVLSITIIIICIILFTSFKFLNLIQINNFVICFLIIFPILFTFCSYKVSINNFNKLDIQ